MIATKRLLVQIGVAATLLLAAFVAGRCTADDGEARTEEIGRLKGELERAGRDVAIAREERTKASRLLDAALSSTDTAITRWRTRTVRDTVILRTAQDTIAHVTAELEATRSAGDSVVRACSELADSCRLFRSAAAAEIASWERRYSVLDSLHKAPRPGKKWHLTLSAGYGLSLSGDVLVKSPVLGVAVSRSLLSW